VPLHHQATLVLETVAALGEPALADDTPVAARARRRARLKPSSIEVHDVRDIDADGIPCRLYRPSDREDLGLLVYFHGGGWVVGDLDSHDGITRSLAVESGAAVLSVDYRLAPEHPYPAALIDATAATRWAFEHASSLGCAPTRLAIGGDSAGANLATVVAQLGAVPLRYQLLIYPVTDARQNTASYTEFADGPFLSRASMSWFIDHYLAGPAGSVDDPRVSPLLASLEALRNVPPGLVITAGHDPLRDEGERYADLLNDVGIPTSLTRYDGMIHGFASMSDALDDGKMALAQAGRGLAIALAC
jgi:acetyl esterase